MRRYLQLLVALSGFFLVSCSKSSTNNVRSLSDTLNPCESVDVFGVSINVPSGFGRRSETSKITYYKLVSSDPAAAYEVGSSITISGSPLLLDKNMAKNYDKLYSGAVVTGLGTFNEFDVYSVQLAGDKMAIVHLYSPSTQIIIGGDLAKEWRWVVDGDCEDGKAFDRLRDSNG